MKVLYKYIPAVSFFVVFLFVTYPLFHGGFFPTMDDVQVVRIDAMTKELLHGQFPVRMIQNLDFGAGSLLFNFYGTLAYYIGALYRIAGVSLVRSTKFVFVLGYLLGAGGMYILVRKFADKAVALFCSLLFLTATYVNYDVYTRGSLGEFFGFMMLPLLFWGFFRLRDTIRIQGILLASIVYALAIMSHPLTAVMGSIFLVFLIIIPPVRTQYLLRAGGALLLGLTLSAFSWVPVALEQKYLSLTTNTFETQQYGTNFFNPLQIGGLQKIPWGITPPLLGVGLFLGAIVGLVLLLRKKTNHRVIGLFAAVCFVVSLFMVSPISKFLWDSNAYIRLVQFPWRYLGITTIGAIILIGVLLANIKKFWLKIFLGILLLLPAVTLQYGYLRPSYYNYIAFYTADDVCNSSTWAQEYLPKWVKTCITKKLHLPVVGSQNNAITISHIQQYPNGNITFLAKSPGVIRIKKYYFPGWIAQVDGKIVPTYPSTSYGLVTFALPPGQHSVVLSFENTADRTIANSISLLSIFLVLSLLIRSRFSLSASKQ